MDVETGSDFPGGLWEFQERIVDSVRSYTERFDVDRREEFRQRLADELSGVPRPTRASARKHSPAEAFQHKIFQGLFEIHESFQRLNDIGTYVRRFPYRKTKMMYRGVDVARGAYVTPGVHISGGAFITRSSYLRYHLENYLQELYILHARLLAYLAKIERAYRPTPNAPKVTRVAKKLRQAITPVFRPAIQARGKHVHEERDQNALLRRLGLLEVLAGGGEPGFQRMYNDAYRAIRRQIRAEMDSQIKSIGKLLDIYFSALQKIIFADQGELAYPMKLRGTPSRRTGDAARARHPGSS